MVAAGASRGAKLKTVRIFGRLGILDPGDVLELRKHVSQVEYCPGFGAVDGDSENNGNNDEEC